MQDELHASALVEESFGDDRAVRGHDAENRFAGADVGDRLICSRRIEPAVADQELLRRCVVALVNRGAHRRHFARQLDRPPEAFTVPERDGRRRALRVFDAHDARFDTTDTPRRGPEHEDITRQALDGEVFI